MNKGMHRKLFIFLFLILLVQLLVPCVEHDLQLTYLNKTASASVIDVAPSLGEEGVVCMETEFQHQRLHKDEISSSPIASVLPVDLSDKADFFFSPKENSQSGNFLVLSVPLFVSHRILRI